MTEITFTVRQSIILVAFNTYANSNVFRFKSQSIFQSVMKYLREIHHFFVFVIIAVTTSATLAAWDTTHLDFIREYAKLNKINSFIAVDKTEKQIVFYGEISRSSGKNLNAILLNDTQQKIKALLIDSVGGDMEGALEMAYAIKKYKLNLVVDGKCMSACANYLFAAAETKRVLPGSVVGIHLPSFHANTEKLQFNQIVYNFSDPTILALDETSKEYARKLAAKEKEFATQFKLNDKLLLSFKSYMANRRQRFGKEQEGNFSNVDPDCPAIQIWVLNRRQLSEIGIRGIGEFWFPRTAAEYSMLSTYFRMPNDSLFFGDAKILSKMCEGSQPWIFRQYYEFKFWLSKKFS